MKRLLTIISLIISCLCQVSLADIVVVGNKDSQIKQLTKKQVIDIYMGRKSIFPNGEAALAIDQEAGTLARKLFYEILVEKSVSEINAYWARLLFSGRAVPPRSTQNGKMVIEMIKHNKAAIGYIQEEDLTDDVRVLTYVN